MDDVSNIIEIPLKSNDSRLDVTGKSANMFCFYEKPKQNNRACNVIELKINQNSIFNNRSWKNIVQNMRDVFCNLHEQTEKSDKEKFSKDLLNICLDADDNYLKIIQNEIIFLETESLKNDSEELNLLNESLKLSFKIWKLSEIFFIKSSPSGALLLDLQEWYKSTNNLDSLIQVLFRKTENNISTNEDYWPIIIASIAQGRIDTAQHLLSFHPDKNSVVFKSIDDLLRKMPNFNTLNHLTTFEFKARWEYWQKDCLTVLRSEDFSKSEDLEVIVKLLCADKPTYFKYRDIFGSWYYMLISYASFSNPTFSISDFNLNLSPQDFIAQYDTDLDVLDQVIYNIFEFDVQSVVKSAVTLLDNNLFTAHFLDLLYLNGKLQLNKQTNGVSVIQLYEENLADYGRSLLDSNLLIFGCDYLKQCHRNINGIEIIEAYIERMPVENEDEGLQMFNLAYKYNLQEQAFSIGRIMQMKAFKIKNYSNALKWCIKIKDRCFGTILAEKLIDEYIQKKDIKLLELMDNSGNEVTFCERLVFLNKYREYLKLTENKCFKEASSLIVQLLEEPQLIPTKFKQNLILGLDKLMSENVFNEDEIFSLLRTVQNFENRIKTFNNLTDAQSKNINDVSSDIIQERSEQESKWKEILKSLSQKLAQRFVENSIEISV